MNNKLTRRIIYYVLVILTTSSLSQSSDEEKAKVQEEREQRKHAVFEKLRNNLQYALCFELFLRIPAEQLSKDNDLLAEFVPEAVDIRLVQVKYFVEGLQMCIERVGKLKQKEIQEEINAFQSGKKDLKYYERFYSFNQKVYHDGKVELTEKEQDTANMFMVVQREVREINQQNRPKEEVKAEESEKELETMEETLGMVKKKVIVDVMVYVVVGSMLGAFTAAVQVFFSLKSKKKGQKRVDGEISKEEKLEMRWLKLKKLRQDIAQMEKDIK